MGLLSSSSNRRETTNNTSTSVVAAIGGAGALSGNTGRIQYSYSETDHGAVQAGYNLGRAGIDAVSGIASKSFTHQREAYNTLAGAYSRQADRLDANATLIEAATQQTGKTVTGMVAFAALASFAVYMARR